MKYNIYMRELYSRVKKYIEDNNLLDGKKSVLAAVSGGADSVCMLLMLNQYSKEAGIRLGVVCVDHGFRIEAADEAEYVKSLCKSCGIDFYLKVIKPGECAKSEEAARLFRYELIKETAKEHGYDKIALAHNANDRAETLLFNLFRGTRIRGLASIRPSRDEFIRPIMCLKRDDIEAYLSEKKVDYCVDATNLEDDYSRNKIRHHILPLSEKINACSIEHMNETAEHMAKVDAYINGVVVKQYEEIVKEKLDGIYIDIKKYVLLDELIRQELLRYILTKLTPHLKDITYTHVEDIDALAFREDNAKISLPYDIKAYREYDYLFIGTTTSATNRDNTYINFHKLFLGSPDGEVIVPLSKQGRLHLKLIDIDNLDGNPLDIMPRNKYTKWFDYDKIIDAVCIRNRRDKDYLIIDNEGHTKSVAKLMIQLKIPERLRDEIPIIASKSEAIWIIGYRESFAYRIDEKTQKLIEMKLEE